MVNKQHFEYMFSFQAILKRSLKQTCSILPLMKKGHSNNLEFFLSNIGKMYMNGLVDASLFSLVLLSSWGQRNVLVGLILLCFVGSSFRLYSIHLFRITMDCNKLCPPVKYPVPVGTPLISPLVEWDHSQTWDVPKVEDFPTSSGGSNSATVYNIGEELTSVKMQF